MKLTKNKAKELSILKWEWYYANPKMQNDYIWKHPQYNLIENLTAECGLCEYYYAHRNNFGSCKGCHLYETGNGCYIQDSYFQKWVVAESQKKRKEYAGLILQIIKDWKV